MVKKKEERQNPTERTKILVWAAAAGRCTFCNRLVTENEDLGETVPIGELAHNVGWGKNSPRGVSALTEKERRLAENFVLTCRNCHKPIDDKGIIGRYTVEVIKHLKKEHEERIKYLTQIDASREATIVRIVGKIRNFNPELTYDTVLGATTAAGLFPKLLAGASSAEYDRNLLHVAAPGTTAYFSQCASQIDELTSSIADAIRRGDVKRLAVFAFARIPILIYLGASLGDKIPILIFQRQRVDDINAWRWPTEQLPPPVFEIKTVRIGKNKHCVALIVSLSGTIKTEDLPASIDNNYWIYSIEPTAPDKPNRELISSTAALSNFYLTAQQFITTIEKDHGKIGHIALFPAVPVSAAVTLGRILMPNVSPAWEIYDRDENGKFFEALEVRK